MNSVLLAVCILAALGLVAGVLLSAASIVLAVPRDEQADRLRELLPGANCGACGYSGCDGYALAMARGEAAVGLCSPGGKQTADATAELLGVASSGVLTQVATVRCGGTLASCPPKLRYYGEQSCAAAAQFFGGDRACSYGCLGYGDCAAACPYEAIEVADGLARINPARCVGCGKCTAVCPRNILVMTPGAARGLVRCSSHEKGAATRRACGAGCIGCMRCVKVCPHEAIHVDQFLASIDSDRCVGCGLCAENCPVGCITVFEVKPAKTDVFAGLPPLS